MSNASAPGPAVDLIEYAADIIVAKRREPHTGPYHWAAALWEAGMLQPPGHVLAAGVAAGRAQAAADIRAWSRGEVRTWPPPVTIDAAVIDAARIAEGVAKGDPP